LEFALKAQLILRNGSLKDKKMAKKRFSPKQNLNKRNIANMPEGKPVLYELLNAKDKNVYTGVAKRNRGQDRLEEHLPGGPDPIPGVTSFRVKPMPSIEKAKAEEKRIIKNKKPKYNEQGK